MNHATEWNVGGALHADHQRIERRRVLAQPFSAVKGEQSDAATGILHEHAADDGLLLIFDELLQVFHLRCSVR